MEEARNESLQRSGSGPVSDKTLELFIKAINDKTLMKQQLGKNYLNGWNANWDKMVREFQENSSNRPLIHPENIHPFFNCALNYCHAKGHRPLVFQYLEMLANSESNFHAAQAAVNICINQLLHEKENTNLNFQVIIEKGISIASHAATIHRTPGYILSALLYLYIGQFFTNSNKLRALENYRLCLQQLLMAEALEVYSEEQIEHCYLGNGISGSNPWKCGSIQELKSQFFALVDPSLLPVKKIQDAVNQEIEELLPLIEAIPDETSGLMSMN